MPSPVPLLPPTAASCSVPRQPRADRLYEAVSARNAQGIYPPEACVFVGNLSNEETQQSITKGLHDLFAPIGPCYVKFNMDQDKKLPGAFVQFQHVEHANLCLSWNSCVSLHGRELRIEKSMAKRICYLGYRSGAPMSILESRAILAGRGSVDYTRLQWVSNNNKTFQIVCEVTFTYVDDCKDAIKHFSRDGKHFLEYVGKGPISCVDPAASKPQIQTARSPSPPVPWHPNVPAHGNMYMNHYPQPNIYHQPYPQPGSYHQGAYHQPGPYHQPEPYHQPGVYHDPNVHIMNDGYHQYTVRRPPNGFDPACPIGYYAEEYLGPLSAPPVYTSHNITAPMPVPVMTTPAAPAMTAPAAPVMTAPAAPAPMIWV